MLPAKRKKNQNQCYLELPLCMGESLELHQKKKTHIKTEESTMMTWANYVGNYLEIVETFKNLHLSIR